MPKDTQIQRSFEIADDGMQGVIGYFHYVKACHSSASMTDIINKLPNAEEDNPSISITDSWKRYYSPHALVRTLKEIFLSYHTRTSTISLISIFEGGLSSFIERLNQTRNISNQPRNYKQRLKWAFDVAKNSMIGQQTPLSDICLNVDHARRIRNLWMHNNGLMNDHYSNDYIDVDGNPPIISPLYQTYLSNNKGPTPLIINPDSFEVLSICHITLLHHIHDAIQRTYFNDTQGYGYVVENKIIEWHRCLTGK